MDHRRKTNLLCESSETVESNVPNDSRLPEKMENSSLEVKLESCSTICYQNDVGEYFSPQLASQLFWETGLFEAKIPSGFYSVVLDKSFKEKSSVIPTIEDLYGYEQEGARSYAMLVDFEKDIKLSKLKEFVIAAVKGLTANIPLVIKKIAEVVSDFYGGTLSEVSATKHFLGEISCINTVGIQLLGKIKHGLCQPRALLFKVLADAIGLDSKLLAGLHVDGRVVLQTDPDKHMSLLVMYNSTELLVDLLRSPGQLIPFSVRALILYHFSGGVDSDAVDNDSCDSPLEPSSPLFPLSDRKLFASLGSPGQDDQSCKVVYLVKGEHIFPKSGPSSPNIKHRRGFPVENLISASRSEPDIAKFFLHRNRRKGIADGRTLNCGNEQIPDFTWIQRRHQLEGARSIPSSPEHPLSKFRSRSTLGGQKQSMLDETDSPSASSSEQSPKHRIPGRRASMNLQRSTSLLHHGADDGRLLETKEITNYGSYNTRNKQVGLAETTVSVDDAGHEVVSVDDAGHEVAGSESKRGSIMDEKESSQCDIAQSQLLNSSVTMKKHLLVSTQGSLQKDMSALDMVYKPSLPFPEWNIDPSELRTGVRVGIGSFGEVYRGVWRGTDVAIKILLEQDLTTENLEDFYNEVSVLSRLRHPNVILFLGACTKPPHLSLVTEYMHLGSLYNLIHTSAHRTKLTWRKRLKMLLDICRGMMCIQRMNIVHRDLKSANCLVDKHLRVKICDFGLSRILVDNPIKDLKAAGTPEWMAPELLRNELFTDKCDVFSFGVIIWELWTLKRPWEGVKPMKVVYAVGHEGARLDIPEGPIGKLISECWAEDPNSRPSYEDIFTRLHECEFSVS